MSVAQRQKPPLGLMPRRIHDEHRKEMIEAAIERFAEADKSPPSEWTDELDEIEARYSDAETPEVTASHQYSSRFMINSVMMCVALMGGLLGYVIGYLAK